MKGIQIGQTMHKTGLFADNLIIYILDPIYYFEFLQFVLGNFGHDSDLFINLEKSKLYPLNLDQDTIPLK